ncbi:MAG: prepilin peptidase [Micavibrio sp.]|nr:prepilin peptidase [Micavibrio sp.]
MIALFIYIFFFALICGIGVLSSISDLRGLKIPNWHSVVVIGAFPLCYVLMWLFGADHVFFSVWSHLIGAGVVFLVTLAMFATGGLGAGDSKLGTAFAFWGGVKGLLPFLFYMAMVGGVLAVFALYLQKKKPFKDVEGDSWVARVQAGESKVPYGIAIVIGALASFIKIGYFSPEVLVSFLQ